MNWALARRDAALRYVGRWMFVGPLLTLTMMGVIASVRFATGPGGARTPLDLSLVVLTLWLPAAIYTLVTATERRCSRFDMELPISSKELWTAHTVALIVAGLLVLAATTAMLLLISWTTEISIGLFPPVFVLGDLLLVFRVIAGLLVGVALAQVISPSLERIPGGRRTVLTLIGALVVLYLLTLALAMLPLAVSLVPAAAAAWLLWSTRERLPGTMVAASLEPGWFGRGRRARSGGPSPATPGRLTPAEWAAAAPARSTARRLWVLFVTTFRSTTKMPVAPIIGVPLLLAAGFTMSGAFGGAIRGDDSIRFSMLFIISYLFLSFSGLPPRKLYMLDAFPVSRRLIFAAMFLPYVATLGLGYGAGRIVADHAENSRELVRFLERDGHQYVSAPLRNGDIALDGNPPEVVAPWGESHEVWSTTFQGTAAPVIHSRFSTPPGSSPEFVAWQISRAVRDLYGEDIGREEVLERYLTTDAAGAAVPVGGALTLAADHPEWRVLPYAPVFPVMVLIVCGLWLAAMSFYLSTLRHGFTEKRKRGTFWWGMIVLMALHVAQFAALFDRTLDHWTLSGASMIAIRELASRLPGGSFTVWVLCGLALYGLYRIAESRFMRVESSPGDDMRIALIERPLGAAGSEGAYAR